MEQQTQLEQETLQGIKVACGRIINMVEYGSGANLLMDEFSALQQYFKKLGIVQNIKECSYGTAFHRNFL